MYNDDLSLLKLNFCSSRIFLKKLEEELRPMIK